MCGRFTLTRDADAAAAAFGAAGASSLAGILPRFNVAPSERAPVVVGEGRRRRIRPMRWGLGPHRVGAARAGAPLINARSETAARKPAFRESFARRRCLVPADGFYEWTREPAGKRPHWIHRPDRRTFAMAGIWNPRSPGSEAPSFAILTTRASPTLARLHDRMPVVLSRDLWVDWLALETDAAGAQRILEVARPPALAFHPVSRRVNRPGREGPEWVDPVAPEAAPEESRRAPPGDDQLRFL